MKTQYIDNYATDKTQLIRERGVHRSVTALHGATNPFIDNHNRSSKPFSWTNSADDIPASIERRSEPSSSTITAIR
jgi:hypothetical protein